ncbi:MAG: ATP-grasp domain-containing protein [Deltaproteobacteria bacterium]|nr:ATP-grasp domain-containing protein [Deltaproteobacteria bacterium]
MKLVILYDRPHAGADPDHTDVLAQIKAVGHALQELGHEYSELPFSLDLMASMHALRKLAPDMVFNLLESVEDSGRLIHLGPSLLDFLQIPYTGSPTEALFVTSNKLLTKMLLRGAGISTPESVSMKEARCGASPLEGPYIIKSVWEHASIGIDETSIVTVKDTRRLLPEMERRSEKLGGEYFAERYIEGREFNLSLLVENHVPKVLPPAEILFDQYPDGKARIVGYSAKWETGSFEYCHTRRSFSSKKGEESLLQEMAEIAKQCWHLFGLRGYARVDFRVDEQDRPWVLEINANPCLSPDAGFAAAAFEGGVEYKEVVRYIIKDIGNLHGPNRVDRHDKRGSYRPC